VICVKALASGGLCPPKLLLGLCLWTSLRDFNPLIPHAFQNFYYNTHWYHTELDRKLMKKNKQKSDVYKNSKESAFWHYSCRSIHCGNSIIH